MQIVLFQNIFVNGLELEYWLICAFVISRFSSYDINNFSMDSVKTVCHVVVFEALTTNSVSFIFGFL